MKKILLSLFVVCITGWSYAQVCIPGTLTAPKNAYILPDSATNFANGCPGTYYEQILYIKAAADTAIHVTSPLTGTILATIDSFVVEANIVGLPSYLTVQSNPLPLMPAGAAAPKSNMLRMLIPGDSLACAKVSGTIPPGTAAGTLPLTINLRVYTSNLHCNDNATLNALIPVLYPGNKTDTLTAINDYRIVIFPTPCWPTSVNSVSATPFSILDLVPNPAGNECAVQFESSLSATMTFTLHDLMGRTVLTQVQKTVPGLAAMHIDTQHLPAGVYTATLSDGVNQLSRRLQIEH